MKTKSYFPQLKVSAICLTFAIGSFVSPTYASEVSVTDGTSIVGTIEEIGPSEIVIRGAAGADLRYSHSRTTKYMDEAGKVVAREAVPSGISARIHYVMEGDRIIAERVVVRRDSVADVAQASSGPEKRTESPSTNEVSTQDSTSKHGVVVSLGKNELAMVSDSGSDAVRYSFTETTQYVDDMGDPISIQTVQPGVPVTIHFAQEGEELVARRVIVRRSETVAALPVVGEKVRSNQARRTSE